MGNCHKKKYVTEETARVVLESIQDNALMTGRKRREKNVYKCRVCGFFHLTKKGGR